jgi:hypothetical protein
MARWMPAFQGVCALLLVGCAHRPSAALDDARVAYERASHGPAAELAPDELRSARLALVDAELAFAAEPRSWRSRDLAYVARRKAEAVARPFDEPLTSR